MDRKSFIGAITGTSVVTLFSIGVLEIFKAAVGFFAWTILKEWWDKRKANKSE